MKRERPSPTISIATSANFRFGQCPHRRTPDPEKTGSQWLVGLSVEQGPCHEANIPHTFSITLQGIVLALPGGPGGERLERAVKANAPAMLFGAAREMIRAFTNRGRHRAIIIPSTNFLPLPLPESTVLPE